MKIDPAAVRLRLSASQMSVIWPGLDRIVLEYSGWSTWKDSLYSYPFRIHPPWPGFDRGTYDADFMQGVTDLWKRLRPITRAGGRINSPRYPCSPNGKDSGH